MGVRLMLGDCLEKMTEIEDGSVDLIAADLPYGTTACKWDAVIPLEPMWDQFGRVLTPVGSVVLTASQPFTSSLIISNSKWFKYCLVWEKSKSTGFLNVSYQPMRSHEDVVVFSRAASTHSVNPTMTFNPQMGIGIPYTDKRTRRKETGYQFHDFPTVKTPQVDKSERYPRSVISIPFDQGQHPTQKPVALFEYLVRTYSNESETVLDCTMGSGTTGVACVNTGRKFIGVERDPGYFQIASDRIAAAQSASPLFPEPATA